MVSSCDIDFRQRYGWIRTPQLERQWGPAREIRQPTENGESLLRFNNGQVLSHLDNNNGQGLPPWTTAEACHPRIMASCFFASWIWQPFANCNRTTAEVCHPRIMASCFRNWSLATVCTCNRITAEVCHPRIIAYCICNWNLTTVCILQSDDGESQLRFEHWRASFHAVQASKTTTLWLPKRRKRYLAVSIENKSKNQTNTHATGWFETDS